MRRIFHRAKALDHLLLASLVEETTSEVQLIGKGPKSTGPEVEAQPCPVSTEEDFPLSDTLPGEGNFTQLAPANPAESVSPSALCESSKTSDVTHECIPALMETTSGLRSQRLGTAESKSGKMECLIYSNNPQKDVALPQIIPSSSSKRDAEQQCDERDALLKVCL